MNVFALVAALLCFASACTPSKYSFESNKKLGTYLKVPRTWNELSQDELFGLYSAGEKQPSPEAYAIHKQVVWEKAWDSSARTSPEHLVLGEADAPVARVNVRDLTVEQSDTMSPATLRNLVLGSYTQKLQDFKELLRNPGTSELVSADFIPLQDEAISREGFFGVRQLFEARNTDDQSLYMIGFIGLVDNARTRLHTLTVHCNRMCFVKNETAFVKVLDSFTVRKP
ncbi:MAG: hypothetical protein ABIS21_03575 [Acidimicrobiales bacterium]